MTSPALLLFAALACAFLSGLIIGKYVLGRP